ncbi:MAG: hypothetical protein IPO60_06320 [Flavobacteriales bacterium]|nr:hypothetical protein [Flavobacteriales bacterium]
MFIGDAKEHAIGRRSGEHQGPRVKDVFFSVDGLNGFSEAIQGVFTRAVAALHRPWSHQLKFVSWKDYKTVCQGRVRLPAG